MKRIICLSLIAFLIILGCTKSDDFPVNPDEDQFKSAKIVLPVLTATPITPWATPGSITIWDNNVGVLNTALWTPPSLGPLPNYSFTQFPNYDFSPYFKINGGTEYNPDKYDLMAHFGYISPEAVTGAVVEFTFTHIKYFLPHMNNINQQRIYTVNNEDNEDGEDNEDKEDKEHNKGDETVITCTTDLVQGMNPMFCFLVKVDCGKEKSEHGKEKSGLTTFWTDMKVNGVSVKGTIKNKVFDCNHDDESKVLFISKIDGATDEIYSMNADGSNVVRLTNNTVPDGRATWSANGKYIAFASGVAGTRDIFVMNAAGQGIRNLTNTLADEDWPEWSPEGNHIIFSSNRDGNHEIYSMDIEGHHFRRLTSRLQDDKWPTWSPNGRKIAFQSNIGTPPLVNTEIFVMNADGSGLTQLTNSPALDQMPTWSPDGKKIAFMSARDGNPEIYVMNADGTDQHNITNSAGMDARPCWSGEGNFIVFISARDGNQEVYKMNGDGTNPVRLTNNAVYDDYPFIK